MKRRDRVGLERTMIIIKLFLLLLLAFMFFISNIHGFGKSYSLESYFEFRNVTEYLEVFPNADNLFVLENCQPNSEVRILAFTFDDDQEYWVSFATYFENSTAILPKEPKCRFDKDNCDETKGYLTRSVRYDCDTIEGVIKIKTTTTTDITTDEFETTTHGPEATTGEFETQEPNVTEFESTTHGPEATTGEFETQEPNVTEFESTAQELETTTVVDNETTTETSTIPMTATPTETTTTTTMTATTTETTTTTPTKPTTTTTMTTKLTTTSKILNKWRIKICTSDNSWTILKDELYLRFLDNKNRRHMFYIYYGNQKIYSATYSGNCNYIEADTDFDDLKSMSVYVEFDGSFIPWALNSITLTNNEKNTSLWWKCQVASGCWLLNSTKVYDLLF